MPVSIDHATRIIFVPQDFLTAISGNQYELNVDDLRLALKDLEDDENGIQLLDTHRHNAPVTLAGVTYAQTFEIINGYRVEFETAVDPYVVRLTGGNNNIADVAILTTVSLIMNNSGGLIVLGAGDPNEVADAVMARVLEGDYTMGDAMRLMMASLFGKVSGAGSGTIHFRNTSDNKDRIVSTVDGEGNRASVTLDPA